MRSLSSARCFTTTPPARSKGVIADVLRSFAVDRGDDWPDFEPLAEFAINDSASALGSGNMPFYADRGQHPQRRRQLVQARPLRI